MQESDYIASLVRNLEVAARLDAGEPEAARDPIELSPLLARVISRHAPLARRRAVELVYAVPEHSPVAIGDLTLIEQAVSNLVQNAVLYNRAGGHVAAILEMDDAQRFRISIKDDGPGIPPDELARLLDRGERGDAARTRHPHGSGLGLSIAARVAAAHAWTPTSTRSGRRPGGRAGRCRRAAGVTRVNYRRRPRGCPPPGPLTGHSNLGRLGTVLGAAQDPRPDVRGGIVRAGGPALLVLDQASLRPHRTSGSRRTACSRGDRGSTGTALRSSRRTPRSQPTHGWSSGRVTTRTGSPSQVSLAKRPSRISALHAAPVSVSDEGAAPEPHAPSTVATTHSASNAVRVGTRSSGLRIACDP